MALFTLEDVRFASRGKEIIRGISMKIEPRTVTCLAGKSGCGKSTLLKLISGILVPSGGRVFYKKSDIQTMSNARNRVFRRECGFVFQDSALWSNQDILQNLNLPLQTANPSMSYEKRMQRIHDVCALVKYERAMNLRPVDLSMGEQKKIAFARALINKPSVLFLDECTESLDRKSGAIIVDLIQDFIANGNTVIYVSHSSNFVNAMGGTSLVIEEGLLTE